MVLQGLIKAAVAICRAGNDLWKAEQKDQNVVDRRLHRHIWYMTAVQ